MAQKPSDLLFMQIPPHLLTTAQVMALERVKHEYNRFGYSHERRIAKLRVGLAGELMFSSLLTYYGLPHLYYAVVGYFDEGYDFRAGSVKIDVKTTLIQNPGRIETTRRLILDKYHLYIADDSGQAHRAGADLYLQSFFLPPATLVFAGFAQGVPAETSANARNIFPARQLAIPALAPTEMLKDLPELKPLCRACGVILTPRTVTRREKTVTETVEEQMAHSYRKKDALFCPQHGEY
jgi:hypothetical protein